MIYVIASILCLVCAGICFAIYQCVVVMNTMQYWWPKEITIKTIDGPKKFKYWSLELFVYSKDRNGDGKATWWEKTFPNDGGHRIGIAMILFFCYATWFRLLPFSIESLGILWSVLFSFLVPIAMWFIVSYGFIITFDKYRNA